MKRKLGISCALTFLMALLPGMAAASTAGSLPGGTSIAVDNTAPVDGDILLMPEGETTVDVVDTGVATVGGGSVAKNTTVVYVFDLSGSMNDTAGVDCDGIAGNDTRLVCEKKALEAVNTAAQAPGSPIDQSGLASFRGVFNINMCVSNVHDVDIGTSGDQLLVAPGLDADSDSVPDIEEVANALVAAGSTCYLGGLQRADEILGSSTNEVNLVVYLSDGINNTGAPVSTFAPVNFGDNTTVLAFALGTATSCTTDDFGLGSLADVAVASSTGDGSCEQVTNLADLAGRLTAAIGFSLDQLEIQVDGGPFTHIPAADIDSSLPTARDFDVKTAHYSTPVTGLAVGEHEICVVATGTDAAGEGSVVECKTIRVIQLTASPALEVHELGLDNTHTVTATLAGDGGGTLVTFTVTGQNAGATGTCSPNPDCTTNSSGQVSFTYSVPVAPSSLGTDTITVSVSAGGDAQSIDVQAVWQDTIAPATTCVETVNPAGSSIPQAPARGGQGQNQDGFYFIGAVDDVFGPVNLEVFVRDTGSGTTFGPFPAGTRIKYTEATGATPAIRAMAGNNGGGGRATAVDYHIIGQGDGAIFAIDGAGNASLRASCLVPRPPK